MSDNPTFFQLIKYWFMAARPKTLMAAISPVAIGTVMAYVHGIYHFPSAGWALAGAILIQIGTNLANDYFDFKKGADNDERLGPTRVTQAGLLSPNSVLIGMCLVFTAALACAFMLYLRVGWPIIVLGFASILCGIFYTAGKKSIGYLGLGDLFVLIFFGPVAVAGTYYVQSYEWNAASLLAGLGPGFISVAILAVNNLRDVDTDVRVGKKTLAVRFGKCFAQLEYVVAIIAGCLTPVLVHYITSENSKSLLAVLALFWAIPGISKVFCYKDPRELNFVLAFTSQILFVYTILFVVGFLL